MGSPPHSLLPSICLRVTLNAALSVLSDGEKLSSFCCFTAESGYRLPLLLTAASAASSAGRSRWSSRQCTAQNGEKRGFGQYR